MRIIRGEDNSPFLVMNLTVGKDKCTALVDTGASVTVVHKKFKYLAVGKLKKVHLFGTAGRTTAYCGYLTIRMGKKIETVKVIFHSFENDHNAGGPPVEILLGLPEIISFKLGKQILDVLK